MKTKGKLFQVSVIFHLAATVRFNERLDTAIRFNVCSVKYVIDVAKACKNLEVRIFSKYRMIISTDLR